ncbi:MAG: helix-turn-helix domain-containing protein [Gemmataceae bacterium]|nr:helix-turn-helix domain-containing protein [Gemmataceae bacterium]
MKGSVEKRIVDRLQEFTEALERGEKISDKFTIRRVVRRVEPKPYEPRAVKKVRQSLGASQSVFALFLGVSVKTISAWEQGVNPPNRMARRFMDEIRKDPEHYRKRLLQIVDGG